MFSPIQKRIVSVASTTVASLLFLACLVFVFVILRNIINIFGGVIWPLVTAFILSMLLHPAVNFFEKHTKLNRSKSTIFLYALAIIFSIALIAATAPIVLNQIIDLLRFLPEFFKNIYASIKEQFPRIIDFLNANFSESELNGYRETLMDSLQSVAMTSLPALQQAGSNLFKFFSLVTGAAIIPVYLFYFLESKSNPTKDLEAQLSFLNPGIKDDIIFLLNEFISIVVSFFRGQILIGIIMGVLLAIGFTLAGLKFGIVLGLTVGLLNIIPYLGTIVGLGTVLPIAWYQPDGGLSTLGLALLVFAIVQIIEGYLLTPKIMGKQTGLHSMTIIISIFFWGVALNGMLGMILAIPLTAFFIIAWRLIKKKYLPQFTGHGEN